ncbi:MAG: hypothetical protein ACE5E6_06485 [Phycisphaerae bacterium]
MKNILVFAVALAFCGGTVLASDLEISVQNSDGSDTVSVAPGGTVDYQVVGVLTDTANEGLALVGFDLTFDGGDLPSADFPTEDPMLNFAVTEGINNPITDDNPNGFGGTSINGDLVQIGGGQNTILNDVDNAPFPLGTVITGVGQTSVVLVTGSLTAPMTAGTFHLTATNGFANVIKAGETGEPFWATEEAGVTAVAGLSIVVGEECILSIVSSAPPNDAIDARQPFEPDGSNVSGWDSIAITFNGDASCVTADAFDITTDPQAPQDPSVMNVTIDGSTATLTFDQIIPELAWTTITFVQTGDSTRIGFLPADAGNDGISNANDVLTLIDNLNGVIDPLTDYQCDIDRSGICNANDVLRDIDLLNGAGEYPVYNGASLP